jgi:hypothetical protein
MKSLLAAGLGALLLLLACGVRDDGSGTGTEQSTSPEVASAALAELVEEYFERTLELNPLAATSIGDTTSRNPKSWTGSSSSDCSRSTTTCSKGRIC